MDSLPVADFAETFLSSLNPQPVVKETADQLITDFLSPTRLQELAGGQNLDDVEFLELEVNTSETTLGNFGTYLPNLQHLKFHNSVIPTVRDLGTSLGHITVLMVSCCGMHDIDGIASMMKLKELYLSYNNVSDISPLSFLDNLEVLDLEGNQLKDLSQLDYLAILGSLKNLNLSSNPLCQLALDDLSYEEVLRTKLSHVKRLDEGHKQIDSNAVSNNLSSLQIIEDERLVTEAIKGDITFEENLKTLTPSLSSNGSNIGMPDEKLLAQSTTPLNTMLTARPQSAYPSRISSAGSQKSDHSFGSRPHSSESGDVNLQDETSTLTFGQVICGNPIRALKSRKQSPLPVVSILNKTPTPAAMQRPATALGYRQNSRLFAANSHANNSMSSTDYDEDMLPKEDVLAELRSWRKMHEARINNLNEHAEQNDLDITVSSDSSSDTELDIDSENEHSSFDVDLEEHSNINTTMSLRKVPSPPKRDDVGYSRNTTSPPPRKLSPSYRKFVPSRQKIGSSLNNPDGATSSGQVHTPTPPKIGLSRPQTAADFRTSNLRKKSLMNLSPRAIVPITLKSPGNTSQNNLSSYKVKAVNEIKQ